MSNVNDQAYLKREQYQESRNLDTRIDLHKRFTLGQHNWYRWTFDHLAFPPQAQVSVLLRVNE